MDREELKQQVCAAIDQRRERIVALGEAIMDDPELGFKEFRTARRVAEVFAELGLPCQEGLAITGVKARMQGRRPGPTVALMGELDALVVPGHPRAHAQTNAAHACGHNAQIAGLVGAALGLAATRAAEHLAGQIALLAVPAEEYVEIDYRLGLVKERKTSFLGGKAEMLARGDFDDIDMALMIHSGSAEHMEAAVGVACSSNGFLAKSVRFIGRAAHAGMAPEQGINALKAAQLALGAIDAQRDTFRDQDCVRVHPILTKGGDLVNIVPAEARLETYVRARTNEAMLDAAAKVDRALKGAAMAMGCQVEIQTVPGYLPLRNDPQLAQVFRANADQLFGRAACRDLPHSGGSTDAGDLSQVMPVLHPMMTGASGAAHSVQWHIADPEAGYLAPAKALAMMAIDLLWDDGALARQVAAGHRPALSKQAYLEQQRAIFKTEIFSAS